MSKEESNAEAPQEGAAAGGDASKADPNADIYENRGTKKIIRLITVIAYMFSVSFVAIVLSAYYLFLWEPPNPRLLRRPVHLSSEPEVQFLLSDQPIVANEPIQLREGSNISRLPFSSRIADMEDAVNNYDRAMNHREKLDESLFLLRNSLVEFLQNRVNVTKSPDRDISRKSRRISTFFNYTSFEKEKISNSTERSSGKESKRSPKIMKRMYDSNGISLTLDSSTISGDEANKDRFTGNRNNWVPVSTQTDSPLIHNSTENKIVGREKSKTNGQANLEEKTIMLNKKDVEPKKPKYRSLRSSDEGYLNARTRIAMNDEHGFDIRTSDKENFKAEQNNEDGAYRVFDLKNESTIDSSRNLEFANGPVTPRRSYESSASLRNITLAFKEARMETMTTNSVTVVNGQSLLPEKITTERQKDMLTILTETTDASTSASPFTKPKDLTIDASKETTEASNRTNSEIN